MKNFNKKYIIFILIGIGFLIIAFVFKSSINGEDKEQTQNLNLNLKLDKGRETEKTQLEAYKAEEKDSLRNLRNKSNFDLSGFGKLSKEQNNINTSLLKKEKTEEEIIDSILNSQKIVYKKPKQTQSPSRVNRLRKKREKRIISQEKKEKAKNEELEKKREKERLNSFFKNSNRSVTKIEKTSQKLRTDKNIKIMVNGDQTIKKGSRINLLLMEDAVVNGILYKRNTKLYGFATFGEHRLYIDINTINNDPVKLKIYDAQDGNLGLYTKQNLVGEVGEEVTDDTVDDINIAGVPVGKTVKKIFKKKNKEMKILIFNRTKFILN